VFRSILTTSRGTRAVTALTCSAFLLALCGISAADASSSAPAGNSGKPLKVLMNVKITGHTFFTEIANGAKSVAEKEEIKLSYTGPTFSNGQQQATQLNSLLKQGYNVLLLSANSPTVLAPPAKQAMSMGMPVITFDADVIPSARDLFVSDISNEAFGKCLIDQAAKFAGPDASVAYVSSNPDSPNQIAWIAASEAYRKAHYPNMKVVTTVYGHGDEGESLQVSQSVLEAHPNVRVLLTPDSGAAPGAAEAITKAGLIGKVISIGQGDLASSRYYIKNGSEISCMWNNYGLGRLLMYLSKYAASNKLPANGTFKGDPDGTWQIKNSVINYASEATVFTKENVGEYTDAGAKK
jgi:ABC-type sugar transport system substrate-binding protein